MNPVEIEDDIRKLELLLYGGSPLRPDAVFGRDEMGHLDGVKARTPEVRVSPSIGDLAGELVIERFIITENHDMRVTGPLED